MAYKDILESAAAGRFSIIPCLNIEHAIENADIKEDLASLILRLPGKEFYAFKKCVIRFSFFIQFTDIHADSDSTKYAVRWSETLRGDPRYAPYEECEAVCQKLFHKMANSSGLDFALMKDYNRFNSFSEALPLDYIRKTAAPLHTARNVDVFVDSEIRKYTKVKQIVFDASINPDVPIFKKIYSDKLQTKCYKTDRTQTGDFKTNRELRWEAHPNNFQFAYRRDCDSAETELMLQICTFQNVPPSLVEKLQEENLLPAPFVTYRCPITGDILNYSDLQYEVRNPDHGRSDFQIGHMNPLKLGGIHRSDNVAWVTKDGNRIQGNLSENDVRELLRRIYRNRPDVRG